VRHTTTRYIVLAAIFTAIGILLPHYFHLFGEVGKMFSPMHIPVLLCGFVCGRRYGAICGAITPALSWLITGGSMPPVFLLLPMIFELTAYGFVAGLAIKLLKPVYVKLIQRTSGKNTLAVRWLYCIAVLVVAMLVGRVVYGLAVWTFFPLIKPPPGFPTDNLFKWILTALFVDTLAGMLLQIVFVPIVLLTLQEAKQIDIFSIREKNAETVSEC